MPALRNPKHEKFARGLAKGKSAAAAYKAAGYSDNRAQASRMQRDATIVQRVDELLQQSDAKEQRALQQAVDRLAITKERVLGELARIAFSDIRKVIRWGETVMVPGAEGGQEAHTPMALIAYDQIDDDAAAAIAEVKQTREGLAFKLHDKRGALVDLGRHLGLFPRQVELSGKGGAPIQHEHRRVEDLTDDELAEIATGGSGDGAASEA